MKRKEEREKRREERRTLLVVSYDMQGIHRANSIYDPEPAGVIENNEVQISLKTSKYFEHLYICRFECLLDWTHLTNL